MITTNFGWSQREKKLAFLFFGGLFLLTSLYLYDRSAHKPINAPTSIVPAKQEEVLQSHPDKTSEAEQSHPVWADIKGAVARPGVYSLTTGQRVDDLVRASGGLLPEANDQMINLAKVVKDGEMIYVPRMGERVESHPVVVPGNSQEGSAKIVPINSASAEELSTLPGIGEVKAQAIIQYRSAHGPFRETGELKNVNGIGEKLYEKIKESIAVD